MIVLLGIFLFLFLIYINRKNITIKFLLSVYLLSFLSTFYLDFIEKQNIDFIAYTYMLFILLLFIFSFYTKYNFTKVDINKKIVLISKIFIVLLFPSLFFYAYYSVNTLLYNDISTVRIDYSADEISFVPQGFMNTLFSAFSTLYYIPMMISFMLLQKGIKIRYSIFLFISSLSFPFLTICYAGRDGIVFWFFNFVFLYLLFKNSLPVKIKSSIKRIFKIVSISIIFILNFITYYRFASDSSYEDGVLSIFIYLGQQTQNFSDIFYVDGLRNKVSLFPGFYSLLGINISSSYEDYQLLGISSEYNVFGFFLKTLILGYGRFFTIIIAILFFYIVRYFINSLRRFNNPIDLLIVFSFFQLLLTGVFYYRNGIGNGDVINFIFILFLLVFKKVRI